MKDSYIDYAMSVIISRALPDARDGLKPVHRRILYAMHKLGLASNKAYKKSAAVVGEVIAKYHPHGDAAVYDSMVRMAQDFSLRYRMVDGQGNFGSVDGDPPAAYRYTETRLTKFAEVALEDLEKQTVDYVANFDESEQEPRVLPSKIPTLLVDGSDGIAVGLATKIPPHNLREIVDALLHLLKAPEATVDDLLKIVKGPDFPTGAKILQSAEIAEAYRTGRGRVIVRATAEIEPMPSNRERIVVTEIPYQVNKAKLLEDIADLVRDKKIDGITDIRDESDRTGMRAVFEIRRGENAQVILNQLYKLTQLQTTFGVSL
jgi:DNA gyrase subunit A